MADSWGWAGTLEEFMSATDQDVLGKLIEHHAISMTQSPSGSQVEAWRSEIEIVRSAVVGLIETGEALPDWGIVFEYELPREGGRRPDVLILAGDVLAVVEFKSEAMPSRQHLDQVDAYARDLSEYHSATHALDVVPILVLVRGDVSRASHYGVVVTNPHGLAEVIADAAGGTGEPMVPLSEWLAADYAPIPSLVRAARSIFEHEPLPRIRRAYSAGVGDAVDYLRGVADHAARNGGMHLALVAGVPGAGKTLVGLRFVYETHFSGGGSQEAVFLSGNGPLVKVLQYTLSGEGREGRVFVRDVHAFLKSYGGLSPKAPREHIWVYDEAQRAWDLEKVTEKRPDGFSEPEDFLRVGEKTGSWALMVGLIGEGQEIHVGEESGLSQWNDALEDVSTPWTVHCPPRIRDVFPGASEVRVADCLDLEVTLRSHKADQLHAWVSSLLAGDIERSRNIGEKLKTSSFAPLVTRNLDAAKRYATERYADAPEARFGLMMSSQRKWASKYGFTDDFYLNPGPWFADGADSPYSCRRLEKAVTEFQCQGLELDLPIIGWGGDLLRRGEAWVVPDGVRKRLRYPDQITKNVYRVLLTRGRDGFVILVPDRPELDEVFDTLLQAGCDRLELVAL